jgi:hypothetical protein
MRNPRSHLIVRRIGSETVVYERARHRAHCLSPLAAAVWREHDGRRSAAEIAVRVSVGCGEPVGEDAVRVALRRLARAGLVEPGAGRRPAAASSGRESQGLARRLALRRVAGLAGLAVLTLATPSPAQVAATCLPNGGGASCTSSAQCCSHCCNGNNNKCTGGGPCI